LEYLAQSEFKIRLEIVRECSFDRKIGKPSPACGRSNALTTWAANFLKR